MRKVCKRGEMLLRRADEEEHWWLFATPIKPGLVVHLPQARRVLVMDVSAAQGSGASFMSQRREFVRHILAGASLHELVLVFASTWRKDVAALIAAMRPESRDRVILLVPET